MSTPSPAADNPAADVRLAWRIRPFDPAAEDRASWLAYHAYRRVRAAEFDPEDPLQPDETVEKHMKEPWHTEIATRYVAEVDGVIAAFCKVGFIKPGTPQYESNKHLAWGHAAVCRPFRGRGIFRALLDRAHDDMREHGATVLNFFTSDKEPEGGGCLEHIGAKMGQAERESRLYFAEVDWGMMRDWVDQLPERAPGYELEIWPDRVPESVFEEYAPVRTEMMNLMPWDDLDHGDIVITPEDLRQQNERLSIDDSEHHTCVARSPEGKIIGITDVRWYPNAPDQADQWFTGVHPDARGLGIGKAIKAKMLVHLRDRYDPKFIGTGNAQSNDAMLGINVKMGFEPHREWYAFQLGIDAMAAYLGKDSASA